MARDPVETDPVETDPVEIDPVEIDKDLVAAAATPMVLAIIREGDTYGYEILQRVRELSGGRLEWTDGMLYPLLHRLRRHGYVTTEWRSPPGQRRRKYYTITDDGRAALADRKRQWATVSSALEAAWQQFLAPPPRPEATTWTP